MRWNKNNQEPLPKLGFTRKFIFHRAWKIHAKIKIFIEKIDLLMGTIAYCSNAKSDENEDVFKVLFCPLDMKSKSLH